MHLNKYGIICQQQIEWLESQYPYTKLHNFIVMPNHVHILIEINRDFIEDKDEGIENRIRDIESESNSKDKARTSRGLSQEARTSRDLSPQESPQKIKSISSLMGAMKTTSSKKIHEMGNNDFQWQRSFHDHIVRNFTAYHNIYNYITDNPRRWEEDKFN